MNYAIIPLIFCSLFSLKRYDAKSFNEKIIYAIDVDIGGITLCEYIELVLVSTKTYIWL